MQLTGATKAVVGTVFTLGIVTSQVLAVGLILIGILALL